MKINHEFECDTNPDVIHASTLNLESDVDNFAWKYSR